MADGGGGRSSADARGSRRAAGAVDPLELWRQAKGTKRDVRSLPRLLADSVTLVRRAGRGVFRVLLLLQLVSAVLMGATVLAGKRALEAVVEADGGGSGTSAALTPLVALALVFAATSLVTAVAGQVQRLLAELVLRATWDRLLDVTTSVDLLAFDDPDFHEHQQRVQISALRRPVTVTDGLAALVAGVAGVGMLVAALLSIAPLVVPVILLGAPAAWVVSRRGARLEYQFVVETTPTLRERVYLRDILVRRDEAQEVRAYSAGSRLRRWHDTKYDDYLRSLRCLVRRRTLLAVLGAAVTVPVIVATFGVLLWLVQTGRITLAGAGAAAVAIRLLSGRLDQLTRGVANLYESSLFLADLEAFVARGTAIAARLDESVKDAPVGPGPPRPVARPGRPAFRTLTLEGVGFTYPGAERPALQDVELEVRAGEVVGLVGENGSGKSTLAKVLAQLYPPTSGRVLWDGAPVREGELEDLRQHVSVVFQDFARYQLSGYSNVTVGPDGSAEADVRSAVRRAGAHDVLERLPAGYGTVLSKLFPGGAELSGGEWQRVALARALYRDAPFVLMDEPTASLDPRAEHELFDDLRRLLAGRTVVLISHRLSSVVSADRIHVLDGGRIVETGTHRSLQRSGGLYADLFAVQAEAYRRTPAPRAS